MHNLASSRAIRTVVAGHGLLLGQAAWYQQPQWLRLRHYVSKTAPEGEHDTRPAQSDTAASRSDNGSASSSSDSISRASTSTTSPDSSNQSLPPGWEDNPDWNITTFSQLPHRQFGYNQHIVINEEFKESLRQILWQFRAPIRYAFAYGSGVFPQGAGSATPTSLSPHPNPPEAISKWQKGGGKMIDFIFGVSYTQHWHSLNITQHRDHYSFLGSFGSGLVSRVQDNWGAGVYFNPYITVNGTLIKYGVVNLDTICRDLSEWDTLYLAGRLHKPVKILRDDPRVRLANQLNLISAVRTALLMLGPKFTEADLYTTIAGISYMGDPRIRFRAENPRKISNIVTNQLSRFRQLYGPLIENLPNVSFTDSRCSRPGWSDEPAIASAADLAMEQDMDSQKRANMVRRLPRAFRERLYFAYQGAFEISGRDFKGMLAERADEDHAGSFKRRQGGQFERRIAEQPDLRDKVRGVIRKTVEWPSASQSIKGLFTAGAAKTWRYLKEKSEKRKAGSRGASEKSGGS